MSKLSKLVVSGGKWIPDDQVFHVTDPHALVQAVGYIKYVYRNIGPVYYRGQSKTYPSLYPSLHRGISTRTNLKKRESIFGHLLKDSIDNKLFLPNTPDYTFAPLLQHYGVRTKWLDLVDNLWIAMWFACHEAFTQGKHSEYLHFSKRIRTYPCPKDKRYVYILLLHTGRVEIVPYKPGLLRGPDSEVIDLRVAAPSTYLRPHAQHGVLIKKRNGDDVSSCNLSPLVVGTLRADLGQALEWLGDGKLLSVHTLFPPPHYDFGYRSLLGLRQNHPPILGSIHFVGA
jgi:hypothetical protein